MVIGHMIIIYLWKSVKSKSEQCSVGWTTIKAKQRSSRNRKLGPPLFDKSLPPSLVNLCEVLPWRPPQAGRRQRLTTNSGDSDWDQLGVESSAR